MECPEGLASSMQHLNVNSSDMQKMLGDIKTTVETGSLPEAATKVQEALELLKNTNLNIAITGESGSGKSSLVNAMRGLQDDDEGAAKVDVTEATMEPTPYSYPNHSNVTMWDLPGIGTPNFRPDTYLQQVNFAHYDFFIIVASERFKCTHAELAREIQKMEKKFYFVRSKVDVDVKNEKRKRNFNKEKTLEKIRDDCVQKLQKEGVSSPQVFLVSRWKFSKYDSCKLQETLLDELDGHKKDVFLLALKNISTPILKRKKEALEKQVWKRALVSCTLGAIPIPFLSIKCDVDILVKSVTEYCKAFGLGDSPLPLLARCIEKPVPKLVGSGGSPQEKKIAREFAMEILATTTGFLMKNFGNIVKEKDVLFEPTNEQMKMMRNILKAKSCLNMIPLFGTIAAGGISFIVTYVMLQIVLEEVAEEAERVLTSTLATDGKKS